jgi:ribosomal protein S18 acetylase RimI-like enzyme
MVLNIIDLNIRVKSGQDNASLERLYRSTRPDLLQLGLRDPLLGNLIEMQFNVQQASYHSQYPDAEHSVSEKRDESIGYLISNKTGEAIRLIYIAVFPHECNRGYGRHLVQALQSEAAVVSKSLKFSVDPLNMPAKHRYLTSGFQTQHNYGANLAWMSK